MVGAGWNQQSEGCVNEVEGVKLTAIRLPNRLIGQRYELEITWCGHQLNWQVFTDSPDPQTAPDFVFNDDFHPLSSSLQSESQAKLRKLLEAWDATHPKYLAVCVKLLLRIFNQYQKHRIDELSDNRLQFEINTLQDAWDIQYLYLQRPSSDGSRVHLALVVKLDQRRLGALYPTIAAAQSQFRVVFEFRLNTGSGYQPQATLQVPTLLSHTLPTFSLPSWSGRSCIVEYMPEAEQSIQQQLDQHLDSVQLAQELLKQLAMILGQPVEVNLLRPAAMFYFLYQASQLLLHVEIPSKFPAEQPVVTLQSILHNSMKEGTYTVKRYPWSPRWAPAEMAARIINHLKEDVPYWIQRLTPG